MIKSRTFRLPAWTFRFSARITSPYTTRGESFCALLQYRYHMWGTASLLKASSVRLNFGVVKRWAIIYFRNNVGKFIKISIVNLRRIAKHCHLCLITIHCIFMTRYLSVSFLLINNHPTVRNVQTGCLFLRHSEHLRAFMYI